jgi:hypothetical protein
MMMKVVLFVTAVGAARAAADPVCLPKGVAVEESPLAADLGLVGGAPTICVTQSGEAPKLVGCWAVDAKTGALSETAAIGLPGHSHQIVLDSRGCSGGLCLTKPPSNDSLNAMVATSTDGAHAVISYGSELFVFDAATRKLVKTIHTVDEKAPDNTNVSNAITDVLYVGNTIYCEGHDAGPFAAVWAYKDDGTRLGNVDARGQVMVYGGSSSVLDDGHAGFATGGLATLAVIAAKDGSRKNLDRHFKRGPCKKTEMEDGAEVGKVCSKHLDKNYTPYVGARLVFVPNGILGLVSQDHAPELAVFDRKLVEKKRLKLALCAK